MDIWSAYRTAAEYLLAKVDIVYNEFHLCAFLNKAVDTVHTAVFGSWPPRVGKRSRAADTFGCVTFLIYSSTQQSTALQAESMEGAAQRTTERQDETTNHTNLLEKV